MITRAITKADGPRLTALFNACECRCFCRYWHFEGDKNDWLARCFGDVETNERELSERVQSADDEALGVVAELDGALVGWLKLAPRAKVEKAYDQRLYRGLPLLDATRTGVYFLGCALVAPDARHRGTATALVKAAIELGRSRGARLLQAFPRRPREEVRDEELWTIPVGALEANGFRPVAGEDPYPVLQLDCSGGTPARPPSPSGVLLIDKPPGMTSHDVVSRMRKRLGTRRVGHAGTLDPMATGLLLVLFGEGTKLEPYLSSGEKSYRAEVALGRSTDTLDKEGETVSEVPPSHALLAELRALELDISAPAPLVRAALASECARREQFPPAFSAIKIGGVRSHRLARKGSAPDLPARQVHIVDLTLASASASDASLTVELRVTKGYYVRSFARDVGEALACSAHLSSLRRTASGPFSLAQAVVIDAPKAELDAHSTSVVEIATSVLPRIALSLDEERDARHGKPLALEPSRLPTAAARAIALTNLDGSALVAIATLEAGTLTVARGFV